MSTLPGFRASFSHHRHSAMSLRTHCIHMNRSRAQTPAPGRHLAMHTLQESGKRSGLKKSSQNQMGRRMLASGCLRLGLVLVSLR
jgi:hypothetical protein